MIFNKQFDEFLLTQHKQKGLALLHVQKLSQDNSYKCLDYMIYKQQKQITYQSLSDKIKGDQFYNNMGEFHRINYQVPKNLHSVRTQTYLSQHLIALYYSLAYYIYHLLKKKMELFHTHPIKGFSTFYGYKINYASPQKSQITYYRDYKGYINSINKYIVKSIKNGRKNLVLKIDIQTFFSTIDHQKLINIIERYSDPLEVKNLGFDENTKSAILDFLQFINPGSTSKGLPIASQNIASNFLSDVYLRPLDDFIFKFILKSKIKNYQVSRYVDDIYICLDVTNLNEEEKTYLLNEFLRNISVFLEKELSLSLNTSKTDIDWIDNEEQADKFVKREKMMSFGELKSSFEFTNMKEHFDAILKVIEKLKQDFNSLEKVTIKSRSNALLNTVFDKQMNNYLQREDNFLSLHETIEDLHYFLLHANRKSLKYLFTLFDPCYISLLQYILASKDQIGSSPHIEDLLVMVSIDERYSGELDKLLLQKKYKSELLRLAYWLNTSKKDRPGFLVNLQSHDSSLISEQIKYLTLNYMKRDYNRCLNHLVNLCHSYCFKSLHDGRKIEKNYKKPDLLKDANPHLCAEDLATIDSMFEIRNSNSISHTSSNGVTFSNISKKLFIGFLNSVNILITNSSKY